MKTKHLLIACSLFTVFFSNCGSANTDKNAEPHDAMPTELKDSTILQTDEENALEKLNNVIDTAKKEK